jgi:hypothetical protein
LSRPPGAVRPDNGFDTSGYGRHTLAMIEDPEGDSAGSGSVCEVPEGFCGSTGYAANAVRTSKGDYDAGHDGTG